MMKRIIALLLALILTVGLLPTVALAADGENPTTDSGSVTKEASKDNLNLVKTVTKEGDNYKVTLESVSYTHLDVYKRQHHHRRRQLSQVP